MNTPHRLVTYLSVSLMFSTLVIGYPQLSLAQSEHEGSVVLQDHRPSALSHAHRQNPADPKLSLDLTVGLTLRNQAELDNLLIAQQDPPSPLYHRWLTPQEFTDRFAPTQNDYDATIEWLHQQNFSITGTWPNRLLVNARASVAKVDKAFGTSITHYDHDGKKVFAPSNNPSIPTSLAHIVTSIGGLDDLSILRPHLSNKPHASTKPNLILGSTTLFGPKDLHVAHNFSPLFNLGLNGTGQKIAIATAFTYKISDINKFESVSGLPVSPSSRFQNFFPTGRTAQLNQETTLDVEWASSMAPGSTIQVVSAKSAALSNFTTVYNYIVTNLSNTHTVSTSWGLCETLMPAAVMTTNHAIFSQGAAQGQSWFAASGDNGSQDCGTSSTLPAVDFPASSPSITAVGGTNLTVAVDTANNTIGYGSETAWSGAGGGKSNAFSKPYYQATSTPPDGKRSVPDVALEAGPTPGNLMVYNGKYYRIWGTSVAAPQWAGLFAIANQKVGGAGLGIANPRIYTLGTLANGYHDVTSGCNSTSTTPGFCASVGYDQVTGWGSYNAYDFVMSY